ncbi:hypothetical protein BGW36DRAFT_387154 [Talaromyces proteolyticus]|uniref:CBM-cenC domain-containing protein n=1 Tax=Talaromyces proteolyticus TaxID=1131652 RepID=A0AAD4PUG8_9EURO|nr:uncharacterized protein BGW36DRAFT_387154 [Talaromyces proteolyticus]KAH8692185.1 hypothetical protein BGW36DRAFT_387154 [Talaromyces proteolyticus]
MRLSLSILPALISFVCLAHANDVGDYGADACVPDWEICEWQQPLIDLLLGIPGVDSICQQYDPLVTGPIVVTVTDTPRPVTATTTLFRASSQVIPHTSTLTKTILQSSQAVVTRLFSSTAIRKVALTPTVTDVEATTVTETDTVTDTSSTTLTDLVTQTATQVITQYTTTTATVTAGATTTSVAPAKRNTNGDLAQLELYGAEDLSEACSCLQSSTLYETVTLPQSTTTRTVILATTLSSSIAVIQTAAVTDVVINTSTADLTVVVTDTSTTISTATITVETTVSATVDQTVDVTETDTVTATATITDPFTTTLPVTVTATVTPTATCGVNLIQNPEFASTSLPPWTVALSGGFIQQYNSNCGVSSYCILFYGSSAGSFTLSQTIDTFAGESYTMSFDYHTWSTPQAGAAFTCHVNNSAETSWSIPLSVSTSSWASYTGTFVASSSSTTFTCTGSTTHEYILNLDAFDIQC